MGRGKKLTKYESGEVSAFKEAGMSLRKIAAKIGKSVKSVHTYLKNPVGYMQKSRAKRPSLITPSMGRLLMRSINKEPTLTSVQLKSTLQCQASSRTVRRYLNKRGFKFVKKHRVPLITKNNKKARLLFAKKYRTWDQEWNSVVFSDEKKFNLDGPDGNQKYWKNRDASSNQSYSRRPSGGGGVMVWGAISFNGRLKLEEVNGRMNAEGYVNMLKNANLKQKCIQLVGSNWIFQQDNAPCHRANLSRVYFEQESINLLNWPANSPDLNIIENMWSQMVREVYKGGRQFSSLPMLKEAIYSAWETISQDYIKTLYKSMKGRVGEVLMKRGGATSY